MTFVKFNPIEKDLRKISNIVDEFFGRDMIEFSKTARTIKPAVNIKETEKEYLLNVVAPGIKKEELKIELENHHLVISFEGDNSDERKGKILRQEFGYAKFKRTFTLPNTIDQEGITASYNNGILSLAIPKKEEEASKMITIQ